MNSVHLPLRQDRDCSSIPQLDTVMRRWFTVLRRYRGLLRPEDARTHRDPWYYRERSQIGFLAAASWLAGAVALEEWRTEKERESCPRNGRGDLWIQVRANPDVEYHIEAKHDWGDITGNPAKEKQKIEKALSKAVACAQQLICPKSARLAFVFLSPCISTRKAKGDLTWALDEWLTSLRLIPNDLVAWYFPKQHYDLTDLPYPWVTVGAALIARRP
jgi:hypothetical protein